MLRLTGLVLLPPVASAHCGWLDDRNDNGEVVFERPPTGLADIWSSLLTAFWYASLSRRRLVVDWPEAATAVDLRDFTGSSRPRRRLEYYKASNAGFREAWRKGDTCGCVVSGNRGSTHWLYEDADMRSRLERRFPGVPDNPLEAAGCALHWLARPTATSLEFAAKLLPLVRGAVCVHVRTGLMLETCATRKVPGCARPDDEMHGRARSIGVRDVSAFLDCAQRHRPDAPLFVATDSSSLRAALRQAYGDRVRLAPWEPDPFASYQTGGGSRGGTSLKRRNSTFDPQALERTFAEWYALTHCDTILASRSGFSRTAAAVAYATRNASVYYVTHPRDSRRCRSSPSIDQILLKSGAGI